MVLKKHEKVSKKGVFRSFPMVAMTQYIRLPYGYIMTYTYPEGVRTCPKVVKKGPKMAKNDPKMTFFDHFLTPSGHIQTPRIT